MSWSDIGNNILSNWFAIVILIVIIAFIIRDQIKRKKLTQDEIKKEQLENARKVADVKYIGDHKEFVVINAERVDVEEFLNVYLSMEKEGYKYDPNLNEFSEFDKIVFMRKTK